MRAFWRTFKYIWPQWPALVGVLFSAIAMAFLFSLSFLAILPLLKVMMGEEGLHGWVDRKVCQWRYSLEFYVPQRTDYADSENPDVAYYLQVTGVEKNSLAAAASLRKGDRIFGAGSSIIKKDRDRFAAQKLLEELSTAAGNSKILIQYKRQDKEGADTLQDSVLDCGTKAVYLNWIEWVMNFLPRQEGGIHTMRAMGIIIIVMIVFTLGRCAAKFYQQYLAEKVVQTAVGNLREDMFAHIMDMPVGFFERENPSDSVSRILRDTGELTVGAKIVLVKTLREPLKALVLFGFAMLLDFKLTLVFLCGAPLTLGVIVKLGRKIKQATKKTLISWGQMLGKLEEAFNSIKVVKVYNRQAYESNTFNGINRRLLKQMLRIVKVDAALEPLMEVLGMLAGGAALMFGAAWVAKQEIDASEFLTLIAVLGAAAESVRKSGDIWTKLQQSNAAAERIYSIVDSEKEKEKPDAIELKPMTGEIEFRDVVFSYPQTNRPVLKGINLTVRAGHNVAIVGPNGSGKTTLANLIPRFYDPDSGQILIDGKDIHNATLSSLRGQIGMVTQNTITFNDTIAANIGYSKPGAGREEIIDAAKRAFAHEFVAPLPDGYDTIIGEQGVGLSGGQLQRIVIARAILKNPAILIFDEATSQVDADSESKIHKAIEEIMHNRTSFIIAHRFSTIITADLIVVMDDGQIVAQGQHDSLMNTCQLYQSLYETQLVKA